MSLWDSLSSIKLAVGLLLAVAAASLLGFLGLSAIYHSPWYIALLLFLSLNTFVCGCKAWGRAARRMRMPSAAATAERVETMRFTEQARSSLAPGSALEGVVCSLRGLGYQVVHNEAEDGAQCVLGRKRAWAAWGSPLLHFSLLVVVIGGIVGTWPGVSFDEMLVLAEGESFDGGNPHATSLMPRPGGERESLFDFELRLDDFRMDYYEDGAVSEYESDLSVLRDGQLLQQKTIRVNDPLKFGGVRFFQSSWGLAAITVRVTRPDGGEQLVRFPLQGSADTGWQIPMQGMHGEFVALRELESTTWSLFAHRFWHHYAVVGEHGHVVSTERAPEGPGEAAVNLGRFPRNAALQLFLAPPEFSDVADFVRLGVLTEGRELEHEGYRFELAELVEWSGISARKDPGVPILYLGFVLIVAASFVTLYLAPRTVRVHLAGDRKGARAVMGATTRIGTGFDREFDALTAALQTETA
ncbi:MAG: cytochrome c biogenesis protein ResB [Armatimonadota bacterium]